MRTFSIACTLACAALLYGCGASVEEGEAQSSATVRAVTVEAAPLHPSLDLIGNIVTLPERTATLSSQVAAQISELRVVEGQQVKKGDPIIVLDARQAEADLARAQAALEEARANAELLKKGPLPAEVEAARQEARNAAATAEGRRAKLNALEELHNKGEISEVQYTIAKSDLAESEASSQAAAQRLKAMEQGTRPEVLAQATARLHAAESDVATQTLNVQFCTIAAPFDGTVTQLPARIGAYVDKPTVLATIADLSSLFARVRIPSDYMTQVREGLTATVTCDASGDAVFDGAVARVGKEADTSSGDVSAYVRIDNSSGVLRPGLSCHVHLALSDIPDSITVPTSAVADRNGTAVVTIIRDDKAYETEVTTGTRTNDLVQITEGVSPGDVVATEGGYGLPEGCPVRIVSDDAQDTKPNN